jgi:hypothetical protein
MNIRNFFSRIVPITPETHPYATATSPDQIIVAGVLQSITADFNDWTWATDGYSTRNGYKVPKWPEIEEYYDSDDRKYLTSNGKGSMTLTRKRINGRFAKEIVVCMEYTVKTSRYDRLVGVTWGQVTVNGVAINPPILGLKIFLEYKKLKAALIKAEKVAADAKKAMEANEAKWNLAESILGMKRNEHGALVPVEKEIKAVAISIEEAACDCDLGELCIACK